MSVRDVMIEKFKTRSATVGVLGLGYVGLPLACTFAEAGYSTVGFDVDERKIRHIEEGRSYIGRVPSERLAPLVKAGKLCAAQDFQALSRCDAAIICVPTPLAEGRSPDLTFVVNTAKIVAEHLHPGEVVILESTTYPGTTEEVLLPIMASTGLKVGQDFFMAFSPEREDPGNTQFITRTIPKIIGGVTRDCLLVASAVYADAIEKIVPVSGTRVAEAAKLLENIYRCVNIALINELKLLFLRMGIDIWEVVEAASTKPFGFTPFYPGPGWGGHCIPVDPFYLTWKARQYDFPARFIELAGEINAAMPEHVVTRLMDGLNLQGTALKDAGILLIGVAYKRDVDDVRESPAIAIIRLLEQKLARVKYHDPHVPYLQSRHLEREMVSAELTPEIVAEADAVVIVTDHRAVDYEMIFRHARLIVDTRNVMAPYYNGSHCDRVLLA